MNIDTDTAGNIIVVSNNTTSLRIESSEVIFPTRFAIPKGTSAERPLSPILGEIRFNTDTLFVEGYDGSNWVNLE